jgi:putative DNA primase/helicase
LVPFDAVFKGQQEDKGLEDTLKREAPGIMALMVQACLEWQSTGLNPPERVTQATRQLFSDLDPIGRFTSERLVEDPDAFLTTEEYTAAYMDFLRDTGYESDGYVERELVSRVKKLPGVKQVIRVGADRVRHRGLVGRRVKEPDTDTDTRHG